MAWVWWRQPDLRTPRLPPLRVRMTRRGRQRWSSLPPSPTRIRMTSSAAPSASTAQSQTACTHETHAGRTRSYSSGKSYSGSSRRRSGSLRRSRNPSTPLCSRTEMTCVPGRLQLSSQGHLCFILALLVMHASVPSPEPVRCAARTCPGGERDMHHRTSSAPHRHHTTRHSLTA